MISEAVRRSDSANPAAQGPQAAQTAPPPLRRGHSKRGHKCRAAMANAIIVVLVLVCAILALAVRADLLRPAAALRGRLLGDVEMGMAAAGAAAAWRAERARPKKKWRVSVELGGTAFQVWVPMASAASASSSGDRRGVPLQPRRRRDAAAGRGPDGVDGGAVPRSAARTPADDRLCAAASSRTLRVTARAQEHRGRRSPWRIDAPIVCVRTRRGDPD